MSSRRLGPKRGSARPCALDWPDGRTTGVPLGTTVPRTAVVARREDGASSGAAAPSRAGTAGRGWSHARATSRSRRSRRPRTGGARSSPRAGSRSRPPRRARRRGRRRPPTPSARERETRSASAREKTSPRPCAARSRTPWPTRKPTRGAPLASEKTPKPTAPFTAAGCRAPRAPRPARRSCSFRSNGIARDARARARPAPRDDRASGSPRGRA